MIQQSLIRQFDVHQLPVHRLPVVSLVRSTIACSPITIASPIVPAQVLHFAYLYSSKALRAEFCAALRSLPCIQVLLSLVRNLLGETRVLLSNVPAKSLCLHLHDLDCYLSDPTIWRADRSIQCFGVRTVKFFNLVCRSLNSRIWSAPREMVQVRHLKFSDWIS